jgi:hypothetical protein
VRLREKGGKRHSMPCLDNLKEDLITYLDGAGLRRDPKKARCSSRSGGALASSPARCCRK